jgi:hypothetical protein
MPREISLSGSEISVLKMLGTSGTQILGKLLLGKIADGERSELVETLISLIDQGYVLSNKVNIRTEDDAETAFFRVSPIYARDLRDAMNPARKRNESRGRRQRRG